MATNPTPQHILDATAAVVKECGGNITAASAKMGIPRTTLQHRIRTYERNKQTANQPKSEFAYDASQWKIDRMERDIRDLREQNRILSEQAHSAESVKRLIHECDRPIVPPKWLTPKFTPNLTGVPTLFLSDWHWDEVVDPRQINGVNAYCREIAVRRMKDCFTKSVTLLFDHMKSPRYDYCNVVMGGDMLSGNIHEELRESNEAPTAQSVLHMLDHLVAGLTMLHDRFGRLYIPCVVGNHGRFDKKPRAKNRAYDSYEFFLYHFLKKHFRTEPAIHFEIAEGAFLPFKTYNTRYLLAHGDQAKGGSGIAGALSPLMLMDHRTRKRAMAIDQPYDILLLGHWHQLMSVKGMRINGSGKGMDEWAMGQGFDFELPAQDLWITHPDHHVTAQWPIYLERKDARF